MLTSPMTTRAATTVPDHMSISSYVFSSLLLGLLCADLTAQRPGRSISTLADRAHLTHAGSTEWGIGFSGILFFARPSTLDSDKATSGISVPGGLHVVSNEEVLVGGRDSNGSGIVQHWRFVGESLALVSSCQFPGADIAGVTYAADHGTLYLLDCIGQRILKGSWNPSQSLATLTATQIVGQAGLSDLVNSDERTLSRLGTSLPPTLKLVRWPFVQGETGATVIDNSAGPAVGSFTRTMHLPLRDVNADQATAREGGDSLRVWAPHGAAFEVVRLDTGTVIGSGVAGLGGFADPTLTESLELGVHYTARPMGQPVAGDEGFSCVVRYGHPEVFANGTAIDPMYFQRGANIGSEFWIEVGLQRPGAPFAADAVIPSIMLLGFRVAGVDPVVPYGDNLLLATGTYLPATCVVAATTGWGLAFTSVVIPNDPGIVGLTYLVQFIMEDGLDYRLSEIYGANIQGSTSPSSLLGAQSSQCSAQSAELLASQYVLGATLQGQVFDSTPMLLQILSRR
jgi:hypothetical protein